MSDQIEGIEHTLSRMRHNHADAIGHMAELGGRRIADAYWEGWNQGRKRLEQSHRIDRITGYVLGLVSGAMIGAMIGWAM